MPMSSSRQEALASLPIIIPNITINDEDNKFTRSFTSAAIGGSIQSLIVRYVKYSSGKYKRYLLTDGGEYHTAVQTLRGVGTSKSIYARDWITILGVLPPLGNTAICSLVWVGRKIHTRPQKCATCLLDFLNAVTKVNDISRTLACTESVAWTR